LVEKSFPLGCPPPRDLKNRKIDFIKIHINTTENQSFVKIQNTIPASPSSSLIL
jgi:hypothetical protein